MNTHNSLTQESSLTQLFFTLHLLTFYSTSETFFLPPERLGHNSTVWNRRWGQMRLNCRHVWTTRTKVPLSQTMAMHDKLPAEQKWSGLYFVALPPPSFFLGSCLNLFWNVLRPGESLQFSYISWNDNWIYICWWRARSHISTFLTSSGYKCTLMEDATSLPPVDRVSWNNTRSWGGINRRLSAGAPPAARSLTDAPTLWLLLAWLIVYPTYWFSLCGSLFCILSAFPDRT